MLFVRYESFRQYIRLYPVTSAILLVNIALFVLMTWVGSSKNPETLIQFGALFSEPPYSGEYWRYVAAAFLHIGFDHLLFNSFSIFVFAPPLERLLGHWRYAVFYLGSGVIGNVVGELLHRGVHLSAGASGAIYGIFAAYLYIAIFHKQAIDKSSSTTIKIVLVVGVIYSFITPSVNWYAHLGGFAGGWLLFRQMIRR
ncbi:rhomboid family intramembrane serine protease [Paenibacillus koleovorans]|uniref:rhomboid family intramembrane serine protease n=1 Tax=Paenibacillus koleovorans TaxID=121608 RepID=UPI000FD6F211|nr:rhomboid family intramembrane serine protease [Paenibacillus koleovorans]